MSSEAGSAETHDDGPWVGDACSLVEAFRAGARTPLEELEATLAAIDRSALNARSFRDDDAAREQAASADVGLPFGVCRWA